MILVDTSGLLAAIDSSQRAHEACAAVVRASRGLFLLSPFVLAELDYLLRARVSAAAQDALLDEVARGAYRLETFSADERHFRALRVGRAKRFRILPADQKSAR